MSIKKDEYIVSKNKNRSYFQIILNSYFKMKLCANTILDEITRTGFAKAQGMDTKDTTTNKSKKLIG